MATAARAFDVVVVGAGPAGGLVAQHVANAGLRVAIVEEHREVGEPVQCGGLVTPRVFDYVSCQDTILGKVHGAEIYSPSGRRVRLDGHKTEAVVGGRGKVDPANGAGAGGPGGGGGGGGSAPGGGGGGGGDGVDGHIELVVDRDGDRMRLRTRLLIG